MAAPEYVPKKPVEKVRSYTSPPWSGEGWAPLRPGDLPFGQPRGAHLGNQGPDQGYALRLVRLFDDRVQLAEGEHRRDVDAGCVLVALKRASLFGRAPVKHDLEVAYTVFGYLDPSPPDDLVALRRELFEEAGHFHHYAESRRIPAAVPADVLRQTPASVAETYRRDWRANLALD